MSVLLSIARLRKHHGERLLLDIADFQLDAGCAYVLTGANGVGKSSLLRILCGLEPADIDGAIFLGQPQTYTPFPPAMRTAIAYVHQHPVMFSTSVAANIAYGLKARGMARSEIAARVDEAITWAGIAHLRERHPTVLSGGEKQRVALARARIAAENPLARRAHREPRRRRARTGDRADPHPDRSRLQRGDGLP